VAYSFMGVMGEGHLIPDVFFKVSLKLVYFTLKLLQEIVYSVNTVSQWDVESGIILHDKNHTCDVSPL